MEQPWNTGRVKVIREIQMFSEPSVTTTSEIHDDGDDFQVNATPVEMPHWIRVLMILLDEPGSWSEAIEKTSVSLMRFFLSVFVLCLVIAILVYLGKRILFRYIHHQMTKKQKKSE